MQWKVYPSRKEYEASSGGLQATHTAIETGALWDNAPGGVWALPDGATKPVYVRKRPGKGKAFYYRVEGETAPTAPKPKGKPKGKPKSMEPLFDLEARSA